jgi:hypothetical protein
MSWRQRGRRVWVALPRRRDEVALASRTRSPIGPTRGERVAISVDARGGLVGTHRRDSPRATESHTALHRRGGLHGDLTKRLAAAQRALKGAKWKGEVEDTGILEYSSICSLRVLPATCFIITYNLNPFPLSDTCFCVSVSRGGAYRGGWGRFKLGVSAAIPPGVGV